VTVFFKLFFCLIGSVFTVDGVVLYCGIVTRAITTRLNRTSTTESGQAHATTGTSAAPKNPTEITRNVSKPPQNKISTKKKPKQKKCYNTICKHPTPFNTTYHMITMKIVTRYHLTLEISKEFEIKDDGTSRMREARVMYTPRSLTDTDCHSNL
jgi:hypothetical protein